jgi:Fe-S-cluster containining protein
MVENHAIMILNRGGEAEKHCGGGEKIIGLDMDVLGEQFHLCVAAGEAPARLADIVPLARVVCTKVVDIVTRKVQDDGGHIPCRHGCAGCCHYLVPLSIPEVFRLMEEFLSRPEFEQKLTQRLWLLTARRVLKYGPFRSSPHNSKGRDERDAEVELVSNWYRNLKVVCPFLNSGTCTIYKYRPLACREHFVTGSDKVCAGGSGKAEVISMPVQITSVLGQLAAALEGTSIEAVMMPLALVWHEANAKRGKRTWPAAMMVERFFELVRLAVVENS